MNQDKVIEYLEKALKSIRENIPNELDLIKAYEKVVNDMESFDYE